MVLSEDGGPLCPACHAALEAAQAERRADRSRAREILRGAVSVAAMFVFALVTFVPVALVLMYALAMNVAR